MSTRQKRTLQGTFSQAANGRTMYEIFQAAPAILFAIADILVARFGCTLPEVPILGLDNVMTKCRRENVVLDLGWDHWSGFYILADSAEGDNLVKEIGAYLDTIIGGKEFERYIHGW